MQKKIRNIEDLVLFVVRQKASILNFSTLVKKCEHITRSSF